MNYNNEGFMKLITIMLAMVLVLYFLIKHFTYLI